MKHISFYQFPFSPKTDLGFDLVFEDDLRLQRLLRLWLRLRLRLQRLRLWLLRLRLRLRLRLLRLRLRLQLLPHVPAFDDLGLDLALLVFDGDDLRFL